MKFLFFLLCFSSGLANAQVQGRIQSTASLPGALKFVISDEAAKVIYQKLSSVASEDPYYGPGKVLVKSGNGIICSYVKVEKQYYCELDIIESGILGL